MSRIPRKAPLSELGRAAVAYAEEGFSVIPIGEDKKPLLPSWKQYQRIPPSLAQVRSWWRKSPDAWIGIVTGAVSKLVVVDADSPEAGQCVAERFGQTSRIARTRRGCHHYYRHPGEPVPNSAGKYGAKIDVRGDGGYTILPSSPGYTWEAEGDWEDLPVYTPPPSAVADDLPLDLNVGVAEGQRNNQAARLAGYLLGKGLRVGETTAALGEWNQKNTPPLPRKEVVATVKSIAKRESRHGKKTQRDSLIECAIDAVFWHDENRTACATFEVNGHLEHAPVRSRRFTDDLESGFSDRFHTAASNQAFEEALRVFEARARHDGETHQTYVRVARIGRKIYIDLGDASWRAVKVTGRGWRVVNNCPDKFLRPEGMQPLPEPK